MIIMIILVMVILMSMIIITINDNYNDNVDDNGYGNGNGNGNGKVIVRLMMMIMMMMMVVTLIYTVLFIECRKTRTKVNSLANHNWRKQNNEEIKIRRKFIKPVPSEEKRVRASHGFSSHWFESGANFANQSLNILKQNQSKREITFDAQLKRALHDKFRE